MLMIASDTSLDRATSMNAGELKRKARDLLTGIQGVRSIGFSWDWAGNRVLQVDVSPESDRSRVRQCLDPLDTQVNVREVSGVVKGDRLN
jgi:hypothetical protein